MGRPWGQVKGWLVAARSCIKAAIICLSKYSPALIAPLQASVIRALSRQELVFCAVSAISKISSFHWPALWASALGYSAQQEGIIPKKFQL